MGDCGYPSGIDVAGKVFLTSRNMHVFVVTPMSLRHFYCLRGFCRFNKDATYLFLDGGPLGFTVLLSGLRPLCFLKCFCALDFAQLHRYLWMIDSQYRQAVWNVLCSHTTSSLRFLHVKSEPDEFNQMVKKTTPKTHASRRNVLKLHGVVHPQMFWSPCVEFTCVKRILSLMCCGL